MFTFVDLYNAKTNVEEELNSKKNGEINDYEVLL
jgi:hypothetical protein